MKNTSGIAYDALQVDGLKEVLAQVRIAQVNDHLYQRLIRILQEAIEGKSKLMNHMISNSEHEHLDQKQAILRKIVEGMTEKSNV